MGNIFSTDNNNLDNNICPCPVLKYIDMSPSFTNMAIVISNRLRNYAKPDIKNVAVMLFNIILLYNAHIILNIILSNTDKETLPCTS